MNQPLVAEGERFYVRYAVVASAAEIAERALAIALEQTVELPEALVPTGFIRDELVGRVEAIVEQSTTLFWVDISYLAESAGGELTQLLNVIFGNSSIKDGIRVLDFDLPHSMRPLFNGPRFGLAGLRSLLGIGAVPLVQTALKPMGLSASQLADLAYRFALGGVDLIKDDHGLTNQSYAGFEARVVACAEAVAKANRETGRKALYAPNITSDFNALMARVRFAKDHGAGALLVSPGLIGFDSMRALADDDSIALPLIAHPTLLGANVLSPSTGFSHGLLFGKLQRLAGADASIYPNYGGRFGFSELECRAIAAGCLEPWHQFKAIAPTPGGGMTFERIPAMQETYGSEVMYLIGGGLYGAGDDLVDSVQRLMRQLGR